MHHFLALTVQFICFRKILSWNGSGPFAPVIQNVSIKSQHTRVSNAWFTSLYLPEICAFNVVPVLVAYSFAYSRSKSSVLILSLLKWQGHSLDFLVRFSMLTFSPRFSFISCWVNTFHLLCAMRSFGLFFLPISHHKGTDVWLLCFKSMCYTLRSITVVQCDWLFGGTKWGKMNNLYHLFWIFDFACKNPKMQSVTAT